jgi:hypothetical protein
VDSIGPVTVEAHTRDVANLAASALALYRPGEPIYEACASEAFEESFYSFDGVMRIAVDSDDLRTDVAALGAFVLACEAAVVAVEYVDRGYGVADYDYGAINELATGTFVDFEVLYLGSGSIIGRIKVVLRNLDPTTKEGRRKIVAVATLATSILALIVTPVPLVIVGALGSLNELIPERIAQLPALTLVSTDVEPLEGHTIEVGDEAA